MDSVEDDYWSISPIQTDLETEAESFIPPQEPKYSVSDTNTPNSTVQPTQQPQDVHQFPVERKTTHPTHVQPQTYQQAQILSVTSIVTAIADSFSTSRLPAPEPTIFNGEPILYPDWKSSVESVNQQFRLTAILLTCGVNSAHAQRQKTCSTARDTAMLELVLVVYSLRFIKCCH